MCSTAKWVCDNEHHTETHTKMFFASCQHHEGMNVTTSVVKSDLTLLPSNSARIYANTNELLLLGKLLIGHEYNNSALFRQWGKVLVKVKRLHLKESSLNLLKT